MEQHLQKHLGSQLGLTEILFGGICETAFLLPNLSNPVQFYNDFSIKETFCHFILKTDWILSCVGVISSTHTI